jgi:hypothetical protein
VKARLCFAIDRQHQVLGRLVFAERERIWLIESETDMQQITIGAVIWGTTRAHSS